MATLINGNGNPAIYAAQDADLIASLAGNITGIAKVGNEFAYTAEDANTISVADGVIVTKEGRRIQLDAGENDTFTIPAGTAGVTNYYIIGYHLHENASGQQVAETFVQLMANATDTIQEDTFRGGASDVYVSLYRVQQDGVNLGTITLLLPNIANFSQVKSDLTPKVATIASGISRIRLGKLRIYNFMHNTNNIYNGWTDWIACDTPIVDVVNIIQLSDVSNHWEGVIKADTNTGKFRIFNPSTTPATQIYGEIVYVAE